MDTLRMLLLCLRESITGVGILEAIGIVALILVVLVFGCFFALSAFLARNPHP